VIDSWSIAPDQTPQVLSDPVFRALRVSALQNGVARISGGVKGDLRLAWPVSIFLEADPLIALSTALSTGRSIAVTVEPGHSHPDRIPGAVLLRVGLPPGVSPSFLRQPQVREQAWARLHRVQPVQAVAGVKYYILIAVLAAALLGSQIAGVFDPISLLVRSLGLSILPGVNYALNALSTKPTVAN